MNQSAQGTDKVNAIINCHLATGRIGKPGCGPFSLTGQPNAMGGREVGGLANMLAAHMGFSPAEVDRVRRFWDAPRMAEREGLKAVQMFEAIARGEIKALWVMATNPAVSLPRAAAVREALGKLELFVVSENVLSNDTVNAGAHVLLPAAAWGEKDGTVTNSERRISRQRGFLPLPGEAKPDWQIVSEVAAQLGFADAFAYRSAADVFREHAALSAFENDGTRDFDIGGLAALSDDDYDALAPVQWPLPRRHRARRDALLRRRRLLHRRPQGPLHRAGAARVEGSDVGRLPAASQHRPHPRPVAHHDAHRHEPAARDRICRSRSSRCIPTMPRATGLADGGFARVATAHGALHREGRRERRTSRPGSIFLPIHWSGDTASCARADDLVAPHTDPYSGQPEAKATPASIAPVAFAMRGFVRTHRPIALPNATWWTRVATADGHEYRIASDHGPMMWHDFAYGMLTADAKLAEHLDQRTYRAAAIVDGDVDGFICIGPAGEPLNLELSELDVHDDGGIVAGTDLGHVHGRDRAGGVRLLRRR